LGDEAAAECIKLGAADYLIKDRLSRLPEAIAQAVAKNRLQTERERAERLKNSIISAALDCVITIDHEGRIIDFNPAAELTFGRKRSEVVGKQMAEHIIPLRLREAHYRGFARLLDTGEGRILGKRLELDALRADGTEFPIELSITATGSWEAPLFTAHIRDIKPRILAQQELRESEERFRSFMRYLPGSAAIRDAGGRYQYVNDAWQRAFGMQAADVLGRTPEEIFPAERAAAIAAIHRQVLETNAPLSRTFHTRSGGSTAWWVSDHFPIPDSQGKPALVGTVAIDITEQKVQEEKINRLNRIHAVLSSVNWAIVRIKDSQELLQEACRIAVEHGNFGMAWIGSVDSTALEVTPVAWYGFAAGEYLGGEKSLCLS
jgi:PAS domain S-box-containing protein